MKQTVYRVLRGVCGADRPQRLYFASKQEAIDFCRSHDYTDQPESLRVDDQEAQSLFERTRFELQV